MTTSTINNHVALTGLIRNNIPTLQFGRFKSFNEFIRSNESLFSCNHVFKSKLAFRNLVFSGNCHKRNTFCIGIAHLLFHLGRVRIDFRSDTILASLCHNRQAVFSFLLTKIDEK